MRQDEPRILILQKKKDIHNLLQVGANLDVSQIYDPGRESISFETVQPLLPPLFFKAVLRLYSPYFLGLYWDFTAPILNAFLCASS